MGRRGQEPPRRSYDDDDNPLLKRTKGTGWKKALGICLCVIVLIVAIGAGAIYFIGHNLYSRSNYVRDEDVQRVDVLPEEAHETVSDEERTGKVLDEEGLKSIAGQMEDVAEKEDIHKDDDVYNILLIGVDRRDRTWNGNSDSMILVSINHTQKRISMISLMRDTYVNIPDVGYAKLNAAYAYGAGPLLLETVTNTYRVQVDRYAAVDFNSMIEIIDTLGGVDITLSDKEAEVANGYIVDMCNLRNEDSSGHLYAGGGTFHADGLQAVGYARIRYVGNSDYQRTERQRYVINQMIAQVKNMDITQITGFIEDILPLVTHNVPEGEVWDMASKVLDLLDYSFVQDRIPYDNMYDVIYVKGQDMLVPEWEGTIERMKETIYGSGKVSADYTNSAGTGDGVGDTTDGETAGE